MLPSNSITNRTENNLSKRNIKCVPTTSKTIRDLHTKQINIIITFEARIYNLDYHNNRKKYISETSTNLNRLY